MTDLSKLTHAELAEMVDGLGPSMDPMRTECARRLREMSVTQDQLADAVRQVNDAERTLERHEHAFDVIAKLVWPECTDAQADAWFYLIHLVTKVGRLARVAANDSQAWDVVRKHVRANHLLSKLSVDQREQLRHLEAERLALAARVLELEEHLAMATEAYGVLRARLMPPAAPEDVDANGAPCTSCAVEVEVTHV